MKNESETMVMSYTEFICIMSFGMLLMASGIITAFKVGIYTIIDITYFNVAFLLVLALIALILLRKIREKTKL